ncbi:hypothetical protein AWI06_21935 [Enterobacter hormaechei subsp. xiangfangensis]|uniref:hypothetical protein n=1 Tax=Enterobacter hormaechei TaxID=158836 RepID=UPI0007501E15|nr:hypothetical protein [Enterobacter hormaechei]KUP98905.1 hypothetical protein AWI06_21935 [Enterobacter hormaechei subsp. xiangfangensis]MBT1773454.1 hypothetical protein [Enterobacter hormaechei subsp. xiangfangensis]MDN4964901.1 hypothetical protein [Enterobacter hormaechei]MDO6155174.1 hypothetical protein [Enterobacter hormaechei]
MYVPIWLVAVVVVGVGVAINHYYKLYRKWEAIAVNNYRRWGKMKYEYECVADLLILDRDWLCQNLKPELREELSQNFRVKWLNNPQYWEGLSKNNQLFGPYPEYEEIRKLVYEHFQEYKYWDVDEELSNYGVKMKRYSRDW